MINHDSENISLCAHEKVQIKKFRSPTQEMESTAMENIHWASHARNQWSHARLHIFAGNILYGILNYTVFFYHIVIVYVRNYHNMVKKYCLEALHEKKKLSLAWDHWFRAWDAQCMCTIIQPVFRSMSPEAWLFHIWICT